MFASCITLIYEREMLNKHLNMSEIPEVIDFCLKEGEIIEIKKDDFFFRKGEISRYLGYIQEGAFRYIDYTSSGKQQIVGYSFQGDFVADYATFQLKIPTMVYTQAINDSIVYAITKEKLKLFYDGNKDIHLQSKFEECFLLDIYSRLLSLYCDTPEERYMKIIKQHPELLKTISLKEIAFFIKVTPETLSRIRGNIFKTDH